MSSENGDSLRDKIKAADDLVTESLWVEEWDCTVHVRGLDGVARDELDNHLMRGRKGGVVEMRGWKAAWVIATARDEQGELIFTLADAEWLNRKSSRALTSVFDLGQRLSGVDKEEARELAKNLLGVPSDSSGSS